MKSWWKRWADKADKEGWNVFLTDGSECNREGNWPYQLNALDDGGVFTGPDRDCDAHKAVVENAKKSQPLALSVLKELRRISKPELSQVYRNALDRGDPWADSILTNDCELDKLEIDIFGRVITR